MKNFFFALATFVFAIASTRANELQVGFAEINLTPELKNERPVWLAGYGQGRRATAVHDPIMARCAVLSDGERTFAIVGADLIGLQLPEADRIHAALPEIDHFVLGSSHNHEGPDVIGIWGQSYVQRGVDDDYIKSIIKKIARCVRMAKADLKPVSAAFGMADDATLLGDSRLPVALDPTLRVLKFTAPDSAKISGLIVQWNCHPEAMGSKNTELTADFPSATVAALQKKHGCPIVYLTGAVGGLMAPPDGLFSDADGKELKEGDFEYMRLYGEAVAALADKAISHTKPVTLTPFKSLRRDVYLPVKNPYYRAAFTTDVLKREAFVDSGDPAVAGEPFGLFDTLKTMAIRTEINLLRLGALDIIGIPGELYPELVYGKFQEPADPGADFPEAALEKSVSEIFPDRSWMLIGLANDEVGYIIPKRQWDQEKPYAYEREKSQYGEINSCSPDVAPILMGALERAAKLIDAEPLRIISHNVWYGFTKKEARKAAWLKWMTEQKPDIVALQELNGYDQAQLQKDAATWGHPHSALLKQEGFPTGLTSRFPITEVKRITEGFHHGLLRCRTAGLIVYVIHLHPSDWEFRIREAALLQADIGSLPEEDQRKVLLIGDFNGFSPKEKTHLEKDGELVEFFKRLDVRDGSNNLNSGKLDYAGIQAFHDAGYADLLHRHLKAGAPYPSTFPTKVRPEEDLGRDRRLDYAFVPAASADLVISAKVVSDEATAILSDHYPLLIEVIPDEGLENPSR